MSAAPTQLSRWATGGGAQITTPSSGFQDSGFVPNTAAGAGVMNWLLNLIYQWLTWLNAEGGIANREACEMCNSTMYSVMSSPQQFNGFAMDSNGNRRGRKQSGYRGRKRKSESRNDRTQPQRSQESERCTD